jgi:hypothetical protein
VSLMKMLITVERSSTFWSGNSWQFQEANDASGMAEILALYPQLVLGEEISMWAVGQSNGLGCIDRDFWSRMNKAEWRWLLFNTMSYGCSSCGVTGNIAAM